MNLVPLKLKRPRTLPIPQATQDLVRKMKREGKTKTIIRDTLNISETQLDKILYST